MTGGIGVTSPEESHGAADRDNPPSGADSTAPAAASFPWGFDASFSFGPENRFRGYFGRDVLSGLVSGIDEFRADAAEKPMFRTLGPAMLGAFMWLDDAELIERIADFPHACVVITKQPRSKYQRARLGKLKPVLERGPGFLADAFPELEFLFPPEDGHAPVVGPSTPAPHLRLPALRTIGYRKTGDKLVPILHTKMALLGDVRWDDEDEFGHPADVIRFRPQRLWLSSANGTASSRANLEFGVWLADAALLREATYFLTELLRHSEDLDPDAHSMEPGLVEPDYDDEAFAEAHRFLHEADEEFPGEGDEEFPGEGGEDPW